LKVALPELKLKLKQQQKKQRGGGGVRTRAVVPEVVGQLADAWSVGANGLPPALAGIETQLFQASLLPELAYLYFLSRPEAKTPPLANVGARMLLLFVFATIPAGIAAKAQFGDVLANVDVLHGTSESLLTFSNLVLALGFARALAMPAGQGHKEDQGGKTSFPFKGIAKFVGVTAGVCGVGALAAATVLHGGSSLPLEAEPSNALSLPTWAVHVSSVAEWSLAMSLVWKYAEHSGNQAWKGMTLAMGLTLFNAYTPCTWHAFYNSPAIGALVPLQALLTLSGSSARAFAAYRVCEEGKRMEETSPSSSSSASSSSSGSGSGFDEDGFLLKLALIAGTGAFAVKYGELLASDFFLDPNYLKALAIMAVPTAATTALIASGVFGGSSGSSSSEEDGKKKKGLSMADVKSFGVAGTVSYVITELAFWAVAFPLAFSWYRVAEGSWLDLSNATDKAKLLGAGTVFINGVRLLVPLRLAAALALAPTVEKTLKRMGVDLKKDQTEAEEAEESTTASTKNFEGEWADSAEVDNEKTFSFGQLAKNLAGFQKNRDPEGPPLGGPSGLEDLSSRLPDCPRTRWDPDNVDIAAVQKQYREEEIPDILTIEAKETIPSNKSEEEWLRENKADLKEKLLKHGAILIKGMDTSKSGAGFRRVYEALGLDVCLDPIHTSGLRKFAIEQDGIYEEVNKPGLRQHYIGLHNESTTNRTAAFGMFVCFMPATEGGGDFFVADGKRILRDMDTEVLQELYDKKIRISVSNLDFFKPIIQDRSLFGDYDKEVLVPRAKDDLAKAIGNTVAPKFDMDLEMVWGADGANEGYRLQAIELPETPINRHPVTKEPLWFCNMHNHSRYLRDNRPCTVPEVGMTETFFGDLSKIPEHILEEMDRASRENIVPTPMKAGDVLLVDNYRMLHGRDIFQGDRLHAVSWFTWPEEANIKEAVSNTSEGNSLNKMINKYVDSLK
jgi:hypothetical protein